MEVAAYPFSMPSAMHPEAIEGGPIRRHGCARPMLLAPLPLSLMPLPYNTMQNTASISVHHHVSTVNGKCGHNSGVLGLMFLLLTSLMHLPCKPTLFYA